MKLPKINIAVFEGDAVKWRPFIESFDATIHDRVDITDIEKFTYLRGLLRGSALQSIEGMPLTNHNYNSAKELLEKRSSNPQLIVSSHMNALIKLPRINGAHVKDLRELRDKVERNIRALNSVGISAEHFGSLLIPIVLEKLPNIVKLQISRTMGNDNWNIDQFMKSINEEISARENYEFLKSNESHETYEERRGTATSLTVTRNERRNTRLCVFCDSTDHYSDKCDVVTEVGLRKEKLKETRRCYRCIRKYHM